MTPEPTSPQQPLPGAGAPDEERIFDQKRRGSFSRVVLPWGRTIDICYRNVQHRLGRSLLTLLCVGVVVAFFASSLSYQGIVSRLASSTDIHTKAIMERAGMAATDEQDVKKQRDQRLWLMMLSSLLCLVGITNAILMSVTERYREIGTLKCLGALDNFIVRLFLIESLFIGLLGSVAGGFVGYVLGILQAGAALEFGLLSAETCVGAMADSVPLAVGLGTVLTMFAAVYPTYVAARMKPVDAMRREV